MPRKFDEVRSLYSDDMSHVFKGGLIYEFTQEPNNYGLIDVLPDKNVQLLPDFHLARKQLTLVSQYDMLRKNRKSKDNTGSGIRRCLANYSNLDISRGLPPCPALELIHHGVKVKQGSFVRVPQKLLKSPYSVYDVDGKLFYMENPKVESHGKTISQDDEESSTYFGPLDAENSDSDYTSGSDSNSNDDCEIGVDCSSDSSSEESSSDTDNVELSYSDSSSDSDDEGGERFTVASHLFKYLQVPVATSTIVSSSQSHSSAAPTSSIRLERGNVTSDLESKPDVKPVAALLSGPNGFNSLDGRLQEVSGGHKGSFVSKLSFLTNFFHNMTQALVRLFGNSQ